MASLVSSRQSEFLMGSLIRLYFRTILEFIKNRIFASRLYKEEAKMSAKLYGVGVDPGDQ